MAVNWWPLTRSRNQRMCICTLVYLMYVPSENENGPGTLEIWVRTRMNGPKTTKMAANWWPLTRSRNQCTCICPMVCLMYMPSENENGPWIAEIQDRTQKHMGFYGAKSLKWPPTGDLWPDHETNARAYVPWGVWCMCQKKMKTVKGHQRSGSGRTNERTDERTNGRTEGELEVPDSDFVRTGTNKPPFKLFSMEATIQLL